MTLRRLVLKVGEIVEAENYILKPPLTQLPE